MGGRAAREGENRGGGGRRAGRGGEGGLGGGEARAFSTWAMTASRVRSSFLTVNSIESTSAIGEAAVDPASWPPELAVFISASIPIRSDSAETTVHLMSLNDVPSTVAPSLSCVETYALQLIRVSPSPRSRSRCTGRSTPCP